MAQITRFDIDSPVKLGQAANTTVAATATAGGTLSATLTLSPGNDVFFAASSPSKILAIGANGAAPFTLVRGDGDSSPVTVRVTLKVAETGLGLPATRMRLVDLQ